MLKSIYDASPIATIGIDAYGSVTYANPAGMMISGLERNEIVGRSLFSLYEDSSPDRLNEGKLLRQEAIIDQEFIIKRKTGRGWALISSSINGKSEGSIQTFLFIKDVSKLKKKERLFSYLIQAATAFTKARDTSVALDQIAHFIVPTFADWFTIDQLTENGLELQLLKHADKKKIKWAYTYRKKYPPDLSSNSGSALVIKTGKPGFVPIVHEEMLDALITDPIQRKEIRKIGLRSVMVIPIKHENKVTGLVNFISSDPERYFDETDLEFAENFANLIGLALENARLNEAAANELLLRKQQEDRFRFLADAIPNMLWTSRPSGEVSYYNQQWHNYTGIDGFDALKEKIWDFLHPDDRASAAVEWPKAMKNGKPTESEHRLMRHDGVYRWHLSRFVPYKNGKGEIELWVGTSTDVHDQKASSIELANANDQLATLNEELSAANEELASVNEEMAATNEELASANEELSATNEELTEAQISLQRSEALFRSIALNIPKSIVIVIDKSHRYIMVEGDLIEKMGYDRRNYEGKHPAEMSPERYEASKYLYERVIAGEQFSVERKSDTGETYLVHLVPLRNENNEVYAGLMVALDISEIKQAEEKSAKLAAIVESSDDAIVSKTLDSIITSWNESAVRMFGYTAEEMIGQTIYKIIPADRNEEETEILSRLKNGERVKHFETQRLTKDGRLLDVSLTISPIKDAQGLVIGASKIARDITEKKLEEQRKNDFIGMVSHELRTPLTTLTAVMQIAGNKLKNSSDSFLISAVARANVQVKRMNSMINGFLDVARLEAGKMIIEKQLFDLAELLGEIVDEMNLIVTTHKINMTKSGPVTVNADYDKISSVISNLIGNAVKYSPGRQSINVSCRSDADFVMVSVHDRGLGIAAQELTHVFDRYYRVNAEHTRHISGFGIGLYLSAEIIQNHGGRIWVESEQGKGSTFHFTLPL